MQVSSSAKGKSHHLVSEMKVSKGHLFRKMLSGTRRYLVRFSGFLSKLIVAGIQSNKVFVLGQYRSLVYGIEVE